MTKPACRQVMRFARLLSFAALAPLGLAASACAQTFAHKEQRHEIIDYSYDDHSEIVASARYELEIRSGAGIPGSRGANQYIHDARVVVLGIVEQCQLGRTLWLNATDGVSLLKIVDQKLTETQVNCLRDAEQPGLRLRDKGANG